MEMVLEIHEISLEFSLARYKRFNKEVVLEFFDKQILDDLKFYQAKHKMHDMGA